MATEPGITTLREPPASEASRGTLHRPSRRRQHRRRRAAALGLVGIVGLLAVIAVSGPGASHVHGMPHASPRHSARVATLGPGALSAAETRAIDRTLAATPYVRVAGAQHRELALTFDDGPGPYTPAILTTLERLGAPATFFEVGVLERYFSASTAVIAARGYPIGDHTETHAPMGQLALRDQRTQLLEQVAATGSYGAPFPRMFRPPYGSWNATTVKLLRRYGMLMVLWTVDTNDYRRPGVRAIVDSAVDGARPGAIILLHDAGGNRTQTVAALPLIIRKLRARGYTFVTVPRLLLDNPAPADQEISSILGTGG